MKTIQEKIEVMQHYANGGFVDIKNVLDDDWSDCVNPQWNWNSYDYRIVEQKKTITIEKWLLLCEENTKPYYLIVESSNIDNYIYDWSSSYSKVKLLETYEVEL